MLLPDEAHQVHGVLQAAWDGAPALGADWRVTAQREDVADAALARTLQDALEIGHWQVARQVKQHRDAAMLLDLRPNAQPAAFVLEGTAPRQCHEMRARRRDHVCHPE
jgi:hypothetical protein